MPRLSGTVLSLINLLGSYNEPTSSGMLICRLIEPAVTLNNIPDVRMVAGSC